MADPATATTTAAAKARARKAAFAARKLAHAGDAGRLSSAASRHLLGFLQPYRGRPVSGYMPIRTEISPLPAMQELARHGPVGVPVIRGPGKALAFHLWQPGCALQPGAFGAPVPASATPMNPQVLILPLVAFDEQGRRLGYGGGFYDRTLARLHAQGPVLAVGLAYDEQKLPDLPAEPTDQPLDAVVTPSGIRRFRA